MNSSLTGGAGSDLIGVRVIVFFYWPGGGPSVSSFKMSKIFVKKGF